MDTLFYILLFVASVYAIARVIQSEAELMTKVLWVVFIAVLPVIGFVAWLFAGPKPKGARY